MCTADGQGLGSVAEALRMANATMDYLNGPDGADLDAASCGSVLRSLGEIEAKFTAAHASVLARFDAADAHDSRRVRHLGRVADAMADMTRPDAKAKVRRMRLLRDQPGHGRRARLRGHLQVAGAGDRRVDQEAARPELRAETIKILVRGRPGGRVAG